MGIIRSKNKQDAISGFTLVEILLATALFITFVSVLIGSFIYGAESTVIFGARGRALLIAEEGLEAARNIRDDAFVNLTDGNHGLSISGNQWVFSGSEDTTGVFTRQIGISTVDSNTKKIISTVTWAQNLQRPGSISLDTYLTNWLAASGPPAGTRIAYYDATNKDLKYASCDTSCTTASNWTKVAVDTSGDVGQYASLAFDTEKPRISYYDVTNQTLKYASCDSNCTTASNWTKITVDSTSGAGQYTSIALDGVKPRISYIDGSARTLKYASCESGCTTASNWTKITVDATNDIRESTSLALDSGKPRISYLNRANDGLMYASCDSSCTTASNWTNITVDSANNAGVTTSLALDSGKPRIAYLDDANKVLRYASCESSCTTASNWTTIAVDSANNARNYTSLILDGTKPRIAYYDINNQDLRYASCETTCTIASNWTKIAVETANDVGQYNSIVVDSSKPRISYYDATGQDLRYASCDSTCTTASNWTKIAIDTTGNVGQYTSSNK